MTDNRIVSVSTKTGEKMDDAVRVIESGGVLGYPTETVYGLGADAGNYDAVKRIFALKQRPVNKPFPLLISGEEAVALWVHTIPKSAERLMAAFWPGPLTLIFRGSSSFEAVIPWEEPRVGLRVSPDPICRALTGRLKRPLVSTSANPAGSPPAVTAAEVDSYFAGKLDLILDDGPRKGRAVSTIVDVTVTPPKILRSGAVSGEQIALIIGEVDEP